MTVGLYIPQIVLKCKNCEGLSFRRRRNPIHISIGSLLRRMTSRNLVYITRQSFYLMMHRIYALSAPVPLYRHSIRFLFHVVKIGK